MPIWLALASLEPALSPAINISVLPVTDLAILAPRSASASSISLRWMSLNLPVTAMVLPVMSMKVLSVGAALDLRGEAWSRGLNLFCGFLGCLDDELIDIGRCEGLQSRQRDEPSHEGLELILVTSSCADIQVLKFGEWGLEQEFEAWGLEVDV